MAFRSGLTDPHEAGTLSTSTQKLTIDDLPPEDTKRWVVRRKAIVVAAVRSGVVTLEEACRRYRLSVEEFISWQNAIDRAGLRGLRVTRTQSSGEKTTAQRQ